jgi:trans-aconitate methyltransferase
MAVANSDEVRRHEEASVPAHRGTIDAIVDAIRDVLGVDRVADLGCGNGLLGCEVAARLPYVQFTGIDLNADLVENAHVRQSGANLRFEMGDVTDLPAGAYDFMLSVDFLHRLHDQPAAIAGIAHGLSRGGRLLSAG